MRILTELFGFLVVAIALGLIVFDQIKEKRKRQKESRHQLDLFGKIKLAASSNIFVLIVGLIIAVSNQGVDAFRLYLQKKKQAQPPNPVVYIYNNQAVPESNKNKIVIVDSISHVFTQGVGVAKDYRLWDLRLMSPDSTQTRYCNQLRYIILRKRNENIDTVKIEYATASDSEINLRCLTHNYVIQKSLKSHFHGSIEMKHSYLLAIDISNEEVDTDIMIINEATYINAFDEPNGLWTGMHINYPTDEIGLVLLFPKDKTINGHELLLNEEGTRNETKFSKEAKYLESDNKGAITWIIKKPNQKVSYKFKWSYNSK